MQDILNERRAAEAAGAPARLRSLGRHRAGSRPTTKSAATSRRRATKRSSPPTRRAAPSIAGEHRLERRLHRHQRVQLPGRQNHAQPGADLHRKSGQGLTRSHGLQFGAHVRTRCHDEWLDRHQEHRHDVDHGRQSGREPSVRFQVGDGSQAPAQREDDRGGSALHAHRGGGRPVPADPRRSGHRVSRRRDPLRARESARSRKSISSTTPMPPSSSRKASSCPRTASIPDSIASEQTYDSSTWNYEGRAGATRRRREIATPAPALPPPTSAYDTTLEHPRCVYQLLKKQYSRYTPEMVERITGIPKDQFLKAADLFTSIRKDGDTKKVATIIYAVGWTQHSFRIADHPRRPRCCSCCWATWDAPAAA